MVTNIATLNLHRAPDPGERRDEDLVWDSGPQGTLKSTIPTLSEGQGPFQDLVRRLRPLTKNDDFRLP